MDMKKAASVCLFLIIACGLAAGAAGQKKIREEDLGPTYREWLKFVTYIIHPREKDVFMKLGSDQDRDVFIQAFWRQRDPTPGTSENEYFDEMKKRFAYINKEFKKGSPREGWMTDQGRIYMILGEPVSKTGYSNLPELQPVEVWSYYGDAAKGQPSNFGLMFFRRSGIGEFKLYDPVADGPLAILKDTRDIRVDDNWQILMRIREIAPDIAPYVHSIVPNEQGLDYAPSMRSAIVMAEVLDAPRKAVNPSYATHFLDYRGVVSLEYLTNFVDSEGAANIVPDPVQGISFLHFSVVPKSLSVDYFEPRDQYYCSYLADVSLRKGEQTIYQYNKEFSYYFPPAESGSLTANGICVQDLFPILDADGTFKLTVLLRNTVGKEFSLFERDIVLKKPAGPKLYAPLVGYKLEAQGQSLLTANKVLDLRLLSDPKNTYTQTDTISLVLAVGGVTDELQRAGEVRFAVRGLQAIPPKTRDIRRKLADFPRRTILHFAETLAGADFPPDYYEVAVTLVDGEGRTLDQTTANFIVSPAKAVARPVLLSKSFPREEFYLCDHVLAAQYEKAGDIAAAAAAYDRLVEEAPEFWAGTIDASGFFLRARKFDRALALIERVKDRADYRFDYCLVKGKVLKEMGRCEEALGVLLEGNRIYNSDTRLLNALAYCFLKTGQKDRAREAVEASLKLDPGQKEAQDLRAEIGK
jgi:GWxTD domain-containing protein